MGCTSNLSAFKLLICPHLSEVPEYKMDFSCMPWCFCSCCSLNLEWFHPFFLPPPLIIPYSYAGWLSSVCQASLRARKFPTICVSITCSTVIFILTSFNNSERILGHLLQARYCAGTSSVAGKESESVFHLHFISSSFCELLHGRNFISLLSVFISPMPND